MSLAALLFVKTLRANEFYRGQSSPATVDSPLGSEDSSSPSRRRLDVQRLSARGFGQAV
jgi:hypothetical protein